MKTMNTTPRAIKIGSTLGFIGGLISIICMAFYFEADSNILVNMGAYMLIAVMFFALAGGLSRGGQWSWNVLLLIAFLTISTVGCTVVFDIVGLYVAVVLAVIGILIVVCLTMPSSKTWADMVKT